MATNEAVTVWLQELRAGRPQAAEKSWEHYYERMVKLAAYRLRTTTRRMADEEDVVVSAFTSPTRRNLG